MIDIINDTHRFGLQTFLPDYCYPLNGEITLIDVVTDKPELTGKFTINKWSDIIHIKADMQNYFINKHEIIPNDSDIHVQSIDINATDFLPSYKYKLTSNVDFDVNNLKCSGVEFKGVARVNPTFSITMNQNSIDIDMQPLYSDGKYCDMRVW